MTNLLQSLHNSASFEKKPSFIFQLLEPEAPEAPKVGKDGIPEALRRTNDAQLLAEEQRARGDAQIKKTPTIDKPETPEEKAQKAELFKQIEAAFKATSLENLPAELKEEFKKADGEKARLEKNISGKYKDWKMPTYSTAEFLEKGQKVLATIKNITKLNYEIGYAENIAKLNTKDKPWLAAFQKMKIASALDYASTGQIQTANDVLKNPPTEAEQNLLNMKQTIANNLDSVKKQGSSLSESMQKSTKQAIDLLATRNIDADLKLSEENLGKTNQMLKLVPELQRITDLQKLILKEPQNGFSEGVIDSQNKLINNALASLDITKAIEESKVRLEAEKSDYYALNKFEASKQEFFMKYGRVDTTYIPKKTKQT